jgi:rhodanese-related sulfurtransferase
MKKQLLLLLIVVPSILLAQYKNDNVKYKTVFIDDLCTSLKNNPDYILLDVRSKGEYADTSTFSNLNIGHLKNAININIDELGSRLNEIKTASNKPVFIYCSHSQRSRRASAMLADSGFAKVYNINGGLTTLNLLRESGVPCTNLFYETNNQYNLVSPNDLIGILKRSKKIFLLDIRKDSVFNGISTNEMLNAYGKINGAVNIPLSKLESSLTSVPTDKNIVIIDDGGNEGPKAAAILLKNGYKNISLAFNGMSAWNSSSQTELPEKNKFWTSPVKYKLISADDFDAMAKQPGSVIVDVRTVNEFNNKDSLTWRNRGNIKGALNIPAAELANQIGKIESYKNRPVLIYSFSTNPEGFRAARLLTEKGFTNVNLLVGGIWNLRWRAANIKDKAHLDKWVENIPTENL